MRIEEYMCNESIEVEQTSEGNEEMDLYQQQMISGCYL
jgi:hypothetical protein